MWISYLHRCSRSLPIGFFPSSPLAYDSESCSQISAFLAKQCHDSLYPAFRTCSVKSSCHLLLGCPCVRMPLRFECNRGCHLIAWCVHRCWSWSATLAAHSHFLWRCMVTQSSIPSLCILFSASCVACLTHSTHGSSCTQLLPLLRSLEWSSGTA